MCCERALDLIHCIIHIYSPFADLHVLKAGFHTEKEGMMGNMRHATTGCTVQLAVSRGFPQDFGSRTLLYTETCLPLVSW